MRNIRNSTVIAIILLAFFYNIERVDVNTHNLFNLQSYVYVLVTLAVLSIVAFPEMTKFGFFRGAMAWTLIYIVVKFIFYPENVPFWGQGNLYLAIIEVALLITALYAGYRLATSIYDIEMTINNLLFIGQNEKIIKLQDAEDLIKAEFYKGRRFSLPLSLLSMEIDSNSVALLMSKTIEEMQQRLLNRYGIVHLTKVLRKYLRRSDNVFVDLENQRLCILSFGTDEKGIELIAEKLKGTFQNELGVNVFIGNATFPDEGRTFEGLLNIALADMQEQRSEK